MTRLALAAASVFVATGALAQTEASVAAHVEKARQLAGEDLKALVALCEPAPAARSTPRERDERIAREIARPVPEPGKAFDNLFYVGAAWVSAWAIKTSQGIILIDALNNNKEAAEVIDPGLRKVGLNPADIKYVIVTHAHGDHYGGATYLQQKHGAKVVMSDQDWTESEKGGVITSAHWGPMPKRDVTVRDGEKVTLGDTSVTAYVTPGHTVGTITPVFEVSSGGRKHRVLLWGGTAFNFGNNIPRLDSYAAATERMAKLAQAEGIDVMISNHAAYDGAFAKLAQLKKQGSMEPNPFVIGTPAVVRGLQAMGECARAQKDRFLLQK